MQAIRLRSSFPWRRCPFCKISRVLPSSSFSTITSSSLYKRISPAGDPKASMIPILEQWLQDGRTLDPVELRFLVSRLRQFKRFSHALQISEWMSDRCSLNCTPQDIGLRLRLISKVHGLEQAETFFDTLPDSSRNYWVYNALLNCYADAKSLKKAETLMQKLKNIGLAKIALPYNVMLKLYFDLGMYEKLDELMQEMEETGVAWNRFTYNIRLNAYAVAGDVKGMEIFQMKMEADPMHKMDWVAYVTAANGYLKAGFIKKSLVMAKRAERLALGKTKKTAYHCLLTIYARANAKEDVFRIWDYYKAKWDVYNKGYLCMVSSLVKLADLEGAEMILEECRSKHTHIDFRMVNLLIRAHCKKGDLEKAKMLLDKMIESGKEPLRSTWDILATGYQRHNRMEDAVKSIKNALLADDRGWKLNKLTLVPCLEYLQEKGDADEVENFKNLLKEHGYHSETLCSDTLKGRKDMFHLNNQKEEQDDDDDDDNNEGDMQEIIADLESKS